jgi:DUF971 family protein
MTGAAAETGQVPSKITLAADRRSLHLDWGDGREDCATAAALREACRSSRSVRARVDGRAVPAAPDLTIVDVRPVGHYAVNLVFSDGHDRGIYPWGYLREIARQEITSEGN